ncbi:MAG: hypothetical protein IH921_13290, partial [Gemmatimonadetes bacterium]|nr:hypothetical protein [Gemmatimonadota bacterium]
MSAEPRNVRDVARFLRQREDLGLGEIFLERLTREQVLQAADEARAEVRRGAQPERRGVPERASGHETARAGPSEPDGLEILQRMRDEIPDLPVIIVIERTLLARLKTTHVEVH